MRTVMAMGLTARSGEPMTAQTFHRLLRNPVYAGWICIPVWSLRERGTFEPLVSQELFDQVQSILDGKKTLVRPYLRNNHDFPLRVFAECGACGAPLTGSWTTGRTKRYAYYRCRNAACHHINNLPAADLHKAFTDLLLRLQPETQHMGKFRDAVRIVWQQKNATADALLAQAQKRLADVRGRKDKLTDMALRGALSAETLSQQMQRLESEELTAKGELEAAKVEQWDVESLLDFACKLVEQPARLWFQSPLDQKQRLQKVFFPEGVRFENGEFRTDASGSFFNLFHPAEAEKGDLASPTGFEPVLPP